MQTDGWTDSPKLIGTFQFMPKHAKKQTKIKRTKISAVQIQHQILTSEGLRCLNLPLQRFMGEVHKHRQMQHMQLTNSFNLMSAPSGYSDFPA